MTEALYKRPASANNSPFVFMGTIDTVDDQTPPQPSKVDVYWHEDRHYVLFRHGNKKHDVHSYDIALAHPSVVNEGIISQAMLDACQFVGSKVYKEGEVICLSSGDKCVIQWDAQHKLAYNCGETLEEFGVNNLRAEEKKRLGI